MNVDGYKVEVVLQENRRFMVPIYQRKYQWGDPRLEPFWEDVSTKAAEVLEERRNRFQHYMGALILSPVGQESQIGRTPVVQIVDGQQRLTTFQIFLAALREVAQAHDLDGVKEQIKDYLFNEPRNKDTDPLTRFKLTPTTSDRQIFHDIIDMPYEEVTQKYRHLLWGRRVPKNTEFPAFRAYFLFHSWIKNFAFNGPENDTEIDFRGEVIPDVGENEIDVGLIENRLVALLRAVLDDLKLVVITLDEGDDAQVIFESLNSRGEPLLAMDLVRNNIFHRANTQGAPVEDLYDRYWNSLDDGWWRESAPNARPRRPRLDHFLAHVLTAQIGGNVSVRELYAEYRAFAVPRNQPPRFQNIQDELMLLDQYAPLYETLEGRTRSDPDPVLQWLGEKLKSWQVTTAYPIAMQIGVAGIQNGEKELLARLIYSFIARRAICGLTTKNLNQVFQSIASEFVENGVSVGTLRNYFQEKAGVSTRFPGEDELRRGVIEGDAYAIVPRTRLVDILWELERASRSRMAEIIEQPNNLWIEHVMPQTWTKDWPFEDGEERDYPPDDPNDPRVMRRGILIHTLGNLTLSTSGLNIAAGNASFAQKKEKFAEHSGLFLNRWFAEKTEWTETEILERGEKLADLAKDIWIGLENIGAPARLA